jgi:hypothetical protein
MHRIGEVFNAEDGKKIKQKNITLLLFHSFTPNGLSNLFGMKKSCAAKQYRMTLSFYTKLKFRVPYMPEP